MRTEPFSIVTSCGDTTVYGYIVKKHGLTFGIDKRPKINKWVVTEMQTRRRIPYYYKTRKNALDGIDGLIDTIKNAVNELRT